MKQYNSIKAKYPDAILLFRMGDFYETFGEDAIKASGILGITLTTRNNGNASETELAGFPYHALDTYLPKLVRAGQRVAICDQLEDPKFAKTIVKRGVTELVTPGVTTDDNVLNHRENNFLASIYIEKNHAGLAFLDISTGEFMASEGTIEQTDKLIQNIQPKEILFERSQHQLVDEITGKKFYTYKLDDWMFQYESASTRLMKHFGTTSLKGFGVADTDLGIIAAGAILQYLDLTMHDKLHHVTSLSRLDNNEYVWLDKFTVRNLELFTTQNDNAKTLIDVIDKTITPMGARLLRRWISFPLKDIEAINKRLTIVGHFNKFPDFSEETGSLLKKAGDLERLISKLSVGKINPREILQLKYALKIIGPIKDACRKYPEPNLLKIADQLNPCSPIRIKIEKEINENCPALISKGGVIADGISAGLDELRNISKSGKDYILKLQEDEAMRTGIPSLKIGFNSVFGYFIEVRNTHKDKVPPEWTRKQTLVNAERYISTELKEYEEKVLGAEAKILQLEEEIYNKLLSEISEYIATLQLNASLLSRIDCLLCFSKTALSNNYCMPELCSDNILDIKGGRHPVIEKQLPADSPYIANDVFLDTDNQQIIIITGPNMSGKSALLRQTALIVLLAQAGSFVPATSAKIGLVDKIFTRVGASDNITQGESTFMVEMIETASILNNLSSKSLILLDEIGRGTSTYDGISIAWAITEYLHEHPSCKAKTLFATHYHELNEMAKTYSRIKNFHVSVKEAGNQVIFLRKLIPGGTEHSFGIHVAEMAGMPKSIVKRSSEILKEMEKSQKDNNLAKPVGEISRNREGFQLSFFQLDDPVLKAIRDKIKNIDINNLTPVEALNKLNEIKRASGL